MKPIVKLFFAAWLLCFAAGATAAESDLRLGTVSIDPLDNESLQRGARLFVNYCLNCHSAKYMRYNRLTDIGLTEQQIRDNLMFATDKVAETMAVAMPSDRAKAWFGATPPDLSVEARVRGNEWLYNYLLSFYRDEKTPTGWNNLVFPNVGMPHVLWQLQGVNKLVETKFESDEKANAFAIGVKGLARLEQDGPNSYKVLTLAPDTDGKQTRGQYEASVTDLVNFLDYIAEPAKVGRVRLGYIVLMFLGVLLILAYLTKREIWKDLH